MTSDIKNIDYLKNFRFCKMPFTEGYYIIQDKRYGYYCNNYHTVAYYDAKNRIDKNKIGWYLIGHKECIGGEPEKIILKVDFSKRKPDGCVMPELNVDIVEVLPQDGWKRYIRAY